ncbi:MAG: 2-oxoisovalerate dehydrogenase component, partial [Kribbellaceae bacterium]|nr:2-oxoisovalerate dehydrogenase component [Kribbellaceae bacterium]
MTAVDELFADRVRALQPVACEHPADVLLSLYDAQLGSRHADLAARWLQSQGHGYYTIGSAGHEGNAAVAAALEPTDPALLHYRSGAFYLARAAQYRDKDGLRDILLGVAAATSEPISGGRHKVFGRHDLAIIPQTSTIASHLPRSVGIAFAIGRARRLNLPTRWLPDSVVVCSFGDASINHSTAVGAMNTAAYCVAGGLPMPIVFVCEDNGLGISVPTPAGWVAQAAQRPGIRYLSASGDDPGSVSLSAREAVEYARTENKPAFLHLRTVRYLGHAGTDVETGYRSAAAITADLAHDPVLAFGRLITGTDLLHRYDFIARRISSLAPDVAAEPTHRSAAAVMAPLAPREPAPTAALARM